MIIDCIADLHGYYPELEGGDLLIMAGDLTARDIHSEYLKFLTWLHKQKYRHCIFIAGNHDILIERDEVLTYALANTTYLCDSGTEFEGLKIWGSPWTLTFPDINPHCTAFTGTEEKLEDKFKLIPDDTDILITHGPPYGYFDGVLRETKWGNHVGHVGSKSLRKYSMGIYPKLHVFGHIHENGGKIIDTGLTKFINCSHVNEYYKPVNKPIRIEI